MKKLVGVLLTILLAAVLTGCVKGKIHLTLNKNNTADVEISLGIDKSLYSMMGSTDPFAELKTSLKNEGYKVSNYSDENYAGIVGKNHYSDLDKCLKNLKITDEAFLTGNDSLKVDKGFFFNKYTIKTNLDLSSIACDSNITEEEKKLQDTFIKRMSFDFIVTLPIKADANNAASVSEDMKTYTWKLMPGENNVISLTLKVPDITKIVLTASLSLIIIILSVIIIRKRRNKKKKDIVN